MQWLQSFCIRLGQFHTGPIEIFAIITTNIRPGLFNYIKNLCNIHYKSPSLNSNTVDIAYRPSR